MQARLLSVGAWVTAAWSLGCASAPNAQLPAKPPEYFRSPTLDYVEPARSASDGEVLGAHQRSVDDVMLANPTNLHLAPGWVTRYGRVYFEPERVARGHGLLVGSPDCSPPVGGGPRLEAVEALENADAQSTQARAALEQAWRDVAPEPHTVSMASVAAELQNEQSHWLRCDNE